MCFGDQATKQGGGGGEQLVTLSRERSNIGATSNEKRQIRNTLN
jgi:hypothetical protein